MASGCKFSVAYFDDYIHNYEYHSEGIMDDDLKSLSHEAILTTLNGLM